jgi:hypothetical protein
VNMGRRARMWDACMYPCNDESLLPWCMWVHLPDEPPGGGPSVAPGMTGHCVPSAKKRQESLVCTAK